MGLSETVARPPPAPIDIAATNELLGRGGFLYSFSIPASHLCLLPLDLNPGSGTPSPASPASPDPRARRTNPLVDLIDTEKLYVDQLTGIIRVGFPSRATGHLSRHCS